jgi:hypothetical protein
MGVKLGGSEIAMYAGSAAIKAAYIGSAKIWEKPSSSGSGSGSSSGSGSGSGSAYSMRNIDELMDLVNE